MSWLIANWAVIVLIVTKLLDVVFLLKPEWQANSFIHALMLLLSLQNPFGPPPPNPPSLVPPAA